MLLEALDILSFHCTTDFDELVSWSQRVADIAPFDERYAVERDAVARYAASVYSSAIAGGDSDLAGAANEALNAVLR